MHFFNKLSEKENQNAITNIELKRPLMNKCEMKLMKLIFISAVRTYKYD